MNQLENTYQDNPLVTAPVSETNAKNKFKIPTDPKLRILYGLASVILILVPLSLVSIIIRKQPNTPQNLVITPTTQPSPTPTSAIAIPNDLQFKLDQISKLSLSPETVPAPQIDDTVGIINSY